MTKEVRCEALKSFNTWFMASDIPPDHMDSCWQAFVDGSWQVEPIENETGPDVRAKALSNAG